MKLALDLLIGVLTVSFFLVSAPLWLKIKFIRKWFMLWTEYIERNYPDD